MFGMDKLAKKFAARLDEVGNEWKTAGTENKRNNTNLTVAEQQIVVGITLRVLAGIVREVFEVE